MQYEEALQVILDFTIEDVDVKELQSESSMQIQNARFEKAFTTYFKKYLDTREPLKATTLKTFSNYMIRRIRLFIRKVCTLYHYVFFSHNQNFSIL